MNFNQKPGIRNLYTEYIIIHTVKVYDDDWGGWKKSIEDEFWVDVNVRSWTFNGNCTFV